MSGGLRTIDPSRVETITNVNDTMQTKDQVHTFIGLMGYNCGYIPQLESWIAPIHDLLREGHSRNEWKDEVHGKIVRDVKKSLTPRPLLKLLEKIVHQC
jgi:6-phosphofructokinase